MILTDYYLAEKLPNTKSKLRLDVLICTGGYEPLESLRNNKGELFFYYCDVPRYFKANVKRKADKCLTKKHNISSIFIPDPLLPFGYGDVFGTHDLILFVFNNSQTQIELFIARGLLNQRNGIYNLLCDGELDIEIEFLIKQAKRYNRGA